MSSDRTIPDLTKDAALQLGELVRNEVRLARAEAVDQFRQMAAGAVSIAMGVALAAAAITLALFALAYGLAEELPMWASALISAAIGGAVAYFMIAAGKKRLAPQDLSLPRTQQQVARDIHAVKETITP